MKQMEKMLIVLMTFLVLGIAGACSDDDVSYLAPVVSGSNTAISVSRDTTDTYKIIRQVSSEAGLVRIELRHKTENTLLNEVTSFDNPNNYTYSYSLDLTAYTQETTLPLVLIMTDKEGQITSLDITVKILLTEIGISFAKEGELTSKFEDFNVATTVHKGEVPLESVAIYVGEELRATYDLSMFGEQKSFDLNLLVTGLKPGANNVKFVTKDKNKQENTVSKVINYTETKVKWQNFSDIEYLAYTLEDGVNYVFSVGRNTNYPAGTDAPFAEDGKLHRLVLSCEYDMVIPMLGIHLAYYSYCAGIDLEYNSEGLVSRLTTVTYTYEEDQRLNEPSEPLRTVYAFAYTSGTREVSKVTKDGVDYLTDFMYIGGNVIRFKIEGVDYNPSYVIKEGEAIRVDQMKEEVTADFTVARENPLYLPELPAVLPLSIYPGVVDMSFSTFFYNKYIFETVGDIDYTVSDVNSEAIQKIQWQLPDAGYGYVMTYSF